MSVRKLSVQDKDNDEENKIYSSEYSIDEIFFHLNNASKRISRKMKIISQQEKDGWERTKNRRY